MICAICKKEIGEKMPIILQYQLPPVMKIRGDEIHVKDEQRIGEMRAHSDCWAEASDKKATYISIGVDLP